MNKIKQTIGWIGVILLFQSIGKDRGYGAEMYSEEVPASYLRSATTDKPQDVLKKINIDLKKSIRFVEKEIDQIIRQFFINKSCLLYLPGHIEGGATYMMKKLSLAERQGTFLVSPLAALSESRKHLDMAKRLCREQFSSKMSHVSDPQVSSLDASKLSQHSMQDAGLSGHSASTTRHKNTPRHDPSSSHTVTPRMYQRTHQFSQENVRLEKTLEEIIGCLTQSLDTLCQDTQEALVCNKKLKLLAKDNPELKIYMDAFRDYETRLRLAIKTTSLHHPLKHAICSKKRHATENPLDNALVKALHKAIDAMHPDPTISGGEKISLKEMNAQEEAFKNIKTISEDALIGFVSYTTSIYAYLYAGMDALAAERGVNQDANHALRRAHHEKLRADIERIFRTPTTQIKRLYNRVHKIFPVLRKAHQAAYEHLVQALQHNTQKHSECFVINCSMAPSDESYLLDNLSSYSMPETEERQEGGKNIFSLDLSAIAREESLEEFRSILLSSCPSPVHDTLTTIESIVLPNGTLLSDASLPDRLSRDSSCLSTRDTTDSASPSAQQEIAIAEMAHHLAQMAERQHKENSTIFANELAAQEKGIAQRRAIRATRKGGAL